MLKQMFRSQSTVPSQSAIATAGVLAATLFAPMAQAQAPTAQAPTSQAPTSQAKVIDSKPIYETVSYTVPREVCRLERATYDDYRDDYRGSRGQRVSRTPPILGAIVGGALGNAVGRGKKNRRIGTAVGAILGGSIGADVARRNSRADDYGSSSHGGYTTQTTQRVCRVEEEYRSEEQVVGYQVTYAYGGETYRTTLPDDPGQYIDIHVQVTPAYL